MPKLNLVGALFRNNLGGKHVSPKRHSQRLFSNIVSGHNVSGRNGGVNVLFPNVSSAQHQSPTELQWSTPIVVSTDPFLRMRIAVDGEGIPHVIWKKSNSFSEDIYYSYQLSDNSWSVPQIIYSSPHTMGNPQLVADENGSLYTAWIRKFGSDNQLIYMIKESGGNWSDPIQAPLQPGTIPVWSTIINLTVQANVIHLFYEGFYEGVYYAFKEEGAEWSQPINISNIPGGRRDFSVIQDHNGILHVIFDVIRSGFVYQSMMYTSLSPGGNWSIPIEIHQLPSTFLHAPTLAVDNEGSLHVAWSDLTQSGDCGAFYMKKPPNGIWGSPEEMPFTYTICPEADIPVAIGPQNVPYVVYFGGTNDTYPRLEYTAKVPGESWDPPTLIVNNGSWMTQMVADTEGNLHLVWENQGIQYSRGESTLPPTSDCNATANSIGSGSWNDSNIWIDNRIPNGDDTVLIRPGHQVTLKGNISVGSLCNYGTLSSEAGFPLEISASEFINNYGHIAGQNGHSGSGNQCGEPGDSITIRGGNPINNLGSIRAGDGGIGENCGGAGGSVYIFGRDTTNKGTICGGNGGNISSRSAAATAGRGGDTHIWGKWGASGSLINSGLACAGSGGHSNLDATGPQNGGNGGTLKLISLPQVILDNGEHFAGKGGHGVAGGSDGQDGRVIIEPQTISLKGPNTKVWGGDVVIFGGEDWTLDFRNLSTSAISATTSITLAVGNNSTIDLSGNDSQVLSAGRNVVIASDNVQIDSNVSLKDIAGDNAEIIDSQILHDMSVLALNEVYSGRPETATPINTTILNGGPEKDSYAIFVENSEGWELSKSAFVIDVEGIDSQEVAISITPSKDAQIGSVSTLTVTVTSQGNPSLTVEMLSKIYLSFEIFLPIVVE